MKETPLILSPKKTMVKDVTTLIELAPYVLPPSLEFSLWLKDTLTFGFRQTIPDYGGEILDHFEVEIAEHPILLGKKSNDTNPPSSNRSNKLKGEVLFPKELVPQSPDTKGQEESNISPTRKMMEQRHQRQQAYFSSLVEKTSSNPQITDVESASLPSDASVAARSLSTATSSTRTRNALDNSTSKEVDSILLRTSLNLTAPASARSKNPFLKGSARGTYVGSHLSSKLSNITSLFREVKVPASRPKQEAQLERKQKIAPKDMGVGKMKKKNPPVNINATSRVITTRAKAGLSFSPPRNRLKSNTLSSAATPINTRMDRDIVTSTPRQIIGETPQKPRLARRYPGDYHASSRVASSMNDIIPPPNLASSLSRPWHHKTNNEPVHLRGPGLKPRYYPPADDGTDVSPISSRGGGGPPSFVLSPMPMPRQKDMSSVVAQAAKAARKRR